MDTKSRSELLGSTTVTVSDPRQVVEAVWRIESARVIAGLARMVHDIGLAEDLAQDALLIALEQWPTSGVPDNPGAWLMLTAKHRAIDQLRRRTRYEQKLAEVGRDQELRQAESTLEDSLADSLDGQ